MTWPFSDYPLAYFNIYKLNDIYRVREKTKITQGKLIFMGKEIREAHEALTT